MTVSAPPEPVLPPPRRPWGVLVLVAVVVVVVGYLAFSSIGSALVYYLTPSELLARGDAGIGQTIRLGGQVKPGSISVDSGDLTFVLTDGDAEVFVYASESMPTRSFREGTGAVVEGQIDEDGIFAATQVIVKHDENYEAPVPGALPSDRGFDRETIGERLRQSAPGVSRPSAHPRDLGRRARVFAPATNHGLRGRRVGRVFLPGTNCGLLGRRQDPIRRPDTGRQPSRTLRIPGFRRAAVSKPTLVGIWQARRGTAAHNAAGPHDAASR